MLFPEIGHVTKFEEQGHKNNPRQHNTTPGAARPPAARISRILGIMEASIPNSSRMIENMKSQFSNISRILGIITPSISNIPRILGIMETAWSN